MNRRKFLQTTATGVLIACPAIVHAEEPVLTSVLRNISNERIYFIEHRKQTIEFNTELLTRYPDLFLPRNQLHSKEGCSASCLKTSYSQFLIKDLKTICGLDPVEEFANILCMEINAEFERALTGWKTENKVFRQYIPLIPIKFFDHMTFEERMGFKTLYEVV